MRTLEMTRIVALGSASLLAVSIAGADLAVAQSSLPPVTVDAPKPRQARTTTVRRAPVSRVTTTRRAPAPLQRAEPVRYVTPSTSTMGAPPAAYAGGQVASGGQLGLLGNRSVMDTPFSQTSYTAELIQNQQARTIRDVLANDPSVRVVQAAGGGADSVFIRGFFYDSGDYAMNGLYGIAPQYSTSANFIERVEVLKGPSALLNGLGSAGDGRGSSGPVGGTINLVTKRAPDYDITQLTTTYASRTQFGANIDVARRYGDNKEWGIRFNGGYRNGNTAFDRQTDEFGNAVFGLDYRGERVRVSADIGYQFDNLSPPLRFITPVANPFLTAIPAPPQAGTNFQVPWAKYQPKDTFVIVRGEVDLTDHVTAYGAFGYHDSSINYTYPSPNLTNIGGVGNWQAFPFIGSDTYKTLTGEAGIRASFDTGWINHAVNVAYSINDRPYTSNGLRPAGLVFGNIYSQPTIAQPDINIPVQRISSGSRLWSVGVSDTMSILDKRIQLTVGVRRQTAGTELLDGLVPTNNRAYAESSAWTPAYAIVVKPIENLSLYANYIEGLQSSIIVTGLYSNVGQLFPPAQTKQVEVGVKLDMGRLTTTISGFEISQPSVIDVGGLPLPSRQLVGEQVNRGIELSVFGEVSPSFRLLGGVTLIDGTLSKTAGGLNDGKSAVGVPTASINIGAEWDTPIRDLSLNGRVIYTGQQFVNPANTLKIPEWTRFDIGARYVVTSPWNGKPIILRANVENLFNESYWASAYSGVITVGAPRTYLVSSTFNF